MNKCDDRRALLLLLLLRWNPYLVCIWGPRGNNIRWTNLTYISIEVIYRMGWWFWRTQIHGRKPTLIRVNDIYDGLRSHEAPLSTFSHRAPYVRLDWHPLTQTGTNNMNWIHKYICTYISTQILLDEDEFKRSKKCDEEIVSVAR